MEIIELSEHPCIFSHSNPWSIREHPRNIGNSLIKHCAEKGGVIGCNTWSEFVAETAGGRHPTLKDWVACVDYAVDLVGADHVAIGTDVCGYPNGELWWSYADKMKTNLPFGKHEVEGISHGHSNFPLLVAALVQRGYHEGDIVKIMGGNWLRVFGQVWGS